MTVMRSGVQQVSARVEELLGSLSSGEFGGAAPAAEELVRLLVGLYGDGLTAIVAALRDGGEAGAELLARIADDPAVEGLLLVHDLHPLDADARIGRALDRVRPYLGSHAGGVQYLGITKDGAARLRLEGSCHGCPSSAATVQLAITGAVLDAAPEVSDVVVEGMTAPEPALLQIGPRPDGGSDAGQQGAGNGPGWVTLPELGPPSSRPVATTAAGTPVIVCAVRGTLYAYLDGCAQCGGSLATAALARELLTCPGCGAGYDVQRAGAGLDPAAGHLHPLPLLADSHGVRVAVPEPA